jgi:hypothetical protein
MLYLFTLVTRWHFNSIRGECEAFSYGGCAGKILFKQSFQNWLVFSYKIQISIKLANFLT